MSQDLPDLQNLLATVREAVDGFAGKLDGESRYHAQVASYLLGMAVREVALGEKPADRDDRVQLARNIRLGLHDSDWEQALETVLGTVIGKVRVTRPDHLAPQHREKADFP